MLVRDIKNGRLVNVPENGHRINGVSGCRPSYGAGYLSGLSGVNALGNLGEQQMVYDGLGNPLGILPFIPLIAKAAATFLPKILPC